MPSQELKSKLRSFWKTFPARTVAVFRSPRWQRRAAWAVAALLFIWALAYAAVPVLLKAQIERVGSEKLGRQVTVGAVDFKPWSLELTISEFAIAKAGSLPGTASQAAGTGTAQALPQLKIKRLYIDAEMQSLLRLAPVADAIAVDEPVLSLNHLGQGRYDIDDILERLKTPADEPARSPLRFALYNLVLTGGSLDFSDTPAGKTHALRELNLSVPFLSNLQSQREVKTAPHLAFKLNGSSFDTSAVGTPFAQTHKTDATLALRGLDLRPYLAYWPVGLPVKLHSAVVHADVKVAFEQTPATVVRLSGTVTADQVRVLDAQANSRDLLAFERLQVGMDDVRPLERSVKLSTVTLSAPVLDLIRDRAGRLTLLPPTRSAINNEAADARPERAAGQNDSKNEARPATAAASAPAAAQPPAPVAPAPWRVEVGSVVVRGGRVNWLDETLASPAQIRLAGVALNASAIRFPFAAAAPLKFDGSMGLDVPVAPVSNGRKGKAVPAAAPAPALLSFSGSATDRAAQVTAHVVAWPLTMAAKYVGQFLLPALHGQLDAQLGVNWQAAGSEGAQVLQLTAPQIAVSDVQLAQGKTSLVSVKRVALGKVDIDVTGQRFKAASMQLMQPKALVERGSDKRWMYERWMVAQGKAPNTPAPRTDAAAAAAAPSWSVAINEVQLEGGALSFSDKAGAKPVGFEVTAANARLGGLVIDDPGPKAQPAKAMPLTASLRLGTGAGRFEPGKLAFNGELGLSPVQAQGRLAIDRLPVQVFEPYFADTVNIDLLRADASFKGRVAYRQTPAGPRAQLTGDVALEEFRANTLAPSEELLAWKSLNLRGLHVALDPARATRVDVKETLLTDFFARVIITPEGRINLQDLLKPPAAVPQDASKTIAAGAGETGAAGIKDAKAAAASPPAAAAGPAGPPPVMSFGPMSLVNGKVLFSDRFVKPSYSANLSELTGRLGAFSSVAPGTPAGTAPPMADLELRGKAEGTASLEILGKLNPLAQPLALDIKGKVRDLELPPLSPYSVKYSGYGITRGKLSVDVNYVVRPDGQLTASNKLVLNQLSFGDKVEGSTASLPVKLAVALLADRHGVIDVDLPISGSLNDPQFSLGPVIVKVIFNLIVKAIAAPFSLLANALGGGGEELGTVGFAAGSAQLAPEARAGLDKVAKALTERPALQLTVVGTSSLEAERDGFKRERLAEMVRTEKRRATVREGGSSTAAISVSPAEYPALLKAVYQRADMAKPRNLIGLAKDLPVPEMEKLLMAGIVADDNTLRELALQRAVAVKDYLAASGLPSARLLLGAPKNAPADAKWTPRAELNLAMP
ncbi:DUF748 domain-containing protein [Polaromonas sp.]|uniref:DUF748 domain-containing protein n=1 Tax=Polaromonas sp. TaxID=1869339 RepID=UPI003CB9656B